MQNVSMKEQRRHKRPTSSVKQVRRAESEVLHGRVGLSAEPIVQGYEDACDNYEVNLVQRQLKLLCVQEFFNLSLWSRAGNNSTVRLK